MGQTNMELPLLKGSILGGPKPFPMGVTLAPVQPQVWPDFAKSPLDCGAQWVGVLRRAPAPFALSPVHALGREREGGVWCAGVGGWVLGSHPAEEGHSLGPQITCTSALLQ